jgi:23S rRNA G2445 N2-methylase RlmL
LLDLRTIEDIFYQLAHITELGRSADALKVLHSATLHSDLHAGLAIWRRAHHGMQPATWRVVSQKEGAHTFRRMDAGQALADALRKALPHRLHAVADDADLESWLWLHGSEALIGLRLSDASMRHRIYKREHLPASLRPTIAAAMSWLSQPEESDEVIDPLCGAGTLIIERARMGAYAELQGGDIRPEAVSMAKRNAGAAGVRALWHTWDARQLSLDDASVNVILSNLPFGKQIGNLTTNTDLYRDLAREFARICRPRGRQVTLTSDDRLWDSTLREAGWRITKKIVVVTLGQPATIFVGER